MGQMTSIYDPKPVRFGPTQWQREQFLEGTTKSQSRMHQAGFDSVFERMNEGELGTSVYILWANLKTGEYMMTFTDRVGATDYYKVSECKAPR